MSDCMTFPDTVEEFMEQYKVVDTDQVYSNGTEFVPIFRMKQWFATQPEIIRCRDCKWQDDGHACHDCRWAHPDCFERRTDEQTDER